MNEKNFQASTRSFPPSGAVDLGVVYGVCCMSANFFKDTMSTLKNATVGGELTSYTQMIRKGIELAEQNLFEEARKLGADGVYAVSVATPQVSTGSAEIVIYGTAYKNL